MMYKQKKCAGRLIHVVFYLLLFFSFPTFISSSNTSLFSLMQVSDTDSNIYVVFFNPQEIPLKEKVNQLKKDIGGHNFVILLKNRKYIEAYMAKDFLNLFEQEKSDLISMTIDEWEKKLENENAFKEFLKKNLDNLENYVYSEDIRYPIFYKTAQEGFVNFKKNDEKIDKSQSKKNDEKKGFKISLPYVAALLLISATGLTSIFFYKRTHTSRKNNEIEDED